VKIDGSFRTADELELATLSWAHWFDEIRLHSSIGYLTTIEKKNQYYRENNPQSHPVLGELTLHQTRSDSPRPQHQADRWIEDKRARSGPDPISRGGRRSAAEEVAQPREVEVGCESAHLLAKPRDGFPRAGRDFVHSPGEARDVDAARQGVKIDSGVRRLLDEGARDGADDGSASDRSENTACGDPGSRGGATHQRPRADAAARA
jgi:putative transposase